MTNSAHFFTPTSTTRPRGVRVIEVFSPKLGRRLQCFGDDVHRQWIRLEADPSVQNFCERPTYLKFADRKLLADFWILQHDEVHQLESVHNCPIHGQWLRVECQSCGEHAPYRLNAQLLDAPFRWGNYRASYAVNSASFLNRRPLTRLERIAITRVQLHYYSS